MTANTDDPFRNASGGIESPAEDAFAITPSDSVDLAVAARSLYVGGAGDVTVITRRGTTVQFPSVPAGGYVLCRCTRVKVTGTSATGIVGLV